ncbi:hypothetical protein BJ944DRAFT_289761 [Cunninghamella echinulata]|nr:hypothetical protein BJ944DRAFT_289761 [Cunninghamella echinulata]
MLMRHINEVKASLSPFNVASRSTRLLLNRINTNEARKANPALKINTIILNDAQAPSHIDIVYRDGNKLSVSPDKMNIESLMLVVNKHAKKLEEKEQANSW